MGLKTPDEGFHPSCNGLPLFTTFHGILLSSMKVKHVGVVNQRQQYCQDCGQADSRVKLLRNNVAEDSKWDIWKGGGSGGGCSRYDRQQIAEEYRYGPLAEKGLEHYPQKCATKWTVGLSLESIAAQIY